MLSIAQLSRAKKVLARGIQIRFANHSIGKTYLFSLAFTSASAKPDNFGRKRRKTDQERPFYWGG
jgi:hypothetical protein